MASNGDTPIPLQRDAERLTHNDIDPYGIEHGIKSFLRSHTLNGGSIDLEGNNIRVNGFDSRAEQQDRLTFNRPDMATLEPHVQSQIHSNFLPRFDSDQTTKIERGVTEKGRPGDDGQGKDGNDGKGYGGGGTQASIGNLATVRATTWADVRQVCGWLNDQGATYALFGSWALRVWGSKRAADDIDFLVPYNGENMRLIRTAISSLPGSQMASVPDIELVSHRVFKVYDDIRVDFMFTSQGLTYYDTEIVELSFDSGLKIPVLSGSTLYRIYQWIKDIQHVGDLEFLRKLGYLPEFTGQIIDPTTPFPAKQPDMLSSSPIVVETEM